MQKKSSSIGAGSGAAGRVTHRSNIANRAFQKCRISAAPRVAPPAIPAAPRLTLTATRFMRRASDLPRPPLAENDPLDNKIDRPRIAIDYISVIRRIISCDTSESHETRHAPRERGDRNYSSGLGLHTIASQGGERIGTARTGAVRIGTVRIGAVTAGAVRIGAVRGSE